MPSLMFGRVGMPLVVVRRREGPAKRIVVSTETATAALKGASVCGSSLPNSIVCEISIKHMRSAPFLFHG